MTSPHFDPGDDRGGPPQPGHYLLRVVRRGPWVPARILHDTHAGLWSAELFGTAIGLPEEDPEAHPDIMRIWHYGRRSTPEEHAYLAAVREWAAAHQPSHPLLHPYQAIDTSGLPPVVP